MGSEGGPSTDTLITNRFRQGEIADRSENAVDEKNRGLIRVYEFSDRCESEAETFDVETLTQFVHECERAYSHNSAVSQYGEHVVSASVGIYEDETRVLDGYTEITVVRIEFGVGLRIEYENSDGYSEDRFGEAAVYGIDETGIVRADANAGAKNDETVAEETPDPVEEGRLLECFG